MRSPIMPAERYGDAEKQYLMVHKCGSTTVERSIGLFIRFVNDSDQGAVIWTCYRDPVERFKSGLYYDLCASGLGALYASEADALFRRVLENDATYSVFRAVDESRKITGRTPHTIAQSAYWLGRRVDVFVPIEQLSDFLMLHYGQCNTSNELVKDDNYQRFMYMAAAYDDRIARAHELDYRLIKQIEPWRWEYGRIFS